jgi:hypothetical protein
MSLELVTGQFDVIEIIDLNTFDTLSQKDIYEQLVPLYKETFKDNERIVFHCMSPLEHKFTDMPAETLIQLQKTLVYIDIPNFFCIIVTNNKDLQQELNYVCEQIATNETPIQAILHEAS